MAITKIFPIHSHLKQAVNYAVDPTKTENGTLLGFYNCRSDMAYKNMVGTQKRFNQWNARDDSVQAYHLIQSFKPHEATPNIAQKIAEEFVSSYLSDKYEVAYGIHTDHDHLHIHYIFNAVSFVDGKKYQTNKPEYYQKIRPLSDMLCAKYGLSVIQNPSEKQTLHYGEWRLKQSGEPSWKDLIKRDIDDIIKDAFNYHIFLEMMAGAGYEIKQGKHVAFRPYGKDRFVRGYKLGDEYSEEAIKKRLELDYGETQRPFNQYVIRKFTRAAKSGKRRKLKGLQAQYFKLLYAMGKIKRNLPQKNAEYQLRKEVDKLEQHKKMYAFLVEHDIKNPNELLLYSQKKQNKLNKLELQKQKLQPTNKEKQAYRHLKIMKQMQDGFDMYTAGNSALFDEHERYLKAKRNLFNLGYDSSEKMEMLLKTQKFYQISLGEIKEQLQYCKNDLRLCGKIAITLERMRKIMPQMKQTQQNKGVRRNEQRHEWR